MAYRLTSRGGSLEIEAVDWTATTRLAEQYGWRPLGTLPPPSEVEPAFLAWPAASVWSGGYVPSDYFGPTITDLDALNLQDALRRAKEARLAERRRLLSAEPLSARPASAIRTNEIPISLSKLIEFLDDGPFHIDDP
jgi:hypothetical protein